MSSDIGNPQPATLTESGASALGEALEVGLSGEASSTDPRKKVYKLPTPPAPADQSLDPNHLKQVEETVNTEARKRRPKLKRRGIIEIDL